MDSGMLFGLNVLILIVFKGKIQMKNITPCHKLLFIILSLYSLIVNTQLCSESDYTHSYTICENGFRDAVWFKRFDSDCVQGIDPPASLFDVRCDIECSDGTFLPFGGLGCELCAPGEFSLGSGVLYSHWRDGQTWEEYKDFNSFCYNEDGDVVQGCGWEILNGQIKSGDESYTSVLNYGFDIIAESGYIYILFKVDQSPQAEQRLQIDGKFYTGTESHSFYGYLELSVPLQKGPHLLAISNKNELFIVKSIEVNGVHKAPESCQICPAGTYSNTSGSTSCTLCGLNTISAEGSTECIPCNSTTYAYPGQSKCSLREPCVENVDWEIEYSECGSDGTRSQTVVFFPPVICDVENSNIPESLENAPCGTCNPGTYRSGSECVPCEAGEYSSNGTECIICDKGSVTPRKLILDYFDSWPSFVSTSCVGDCFGDGWRLKDTEIDSGIGHGRYAEVKLHINTEINSEGSIIIEYEPHTDRFYYLYLQDIAEGRDYPYYYYYSDSVEGINTINVPLSHGKHNLTFTYFHYDEDMTAQTDHISILKIELYGSLSGLPTSCERCGPGQEPSMDRTVCLPCEGGTYKSSDMDTCQACPSGTVSQKGQGECISCGHNVFPNSDQDECDETCEFSIGENNFDMSPLARTNEMYGPINDREGHTYYLNICSKRHSDRVCSDSNGDPISTYACQITTNNIGKDLGDTMGFYEGVDGIVLEFTHGSTCSDGQVRTTNVTFYCDPSQGIGYPRPGVSGSIVEDSHCHYIFTWASLYACPLCTNSDYSYYYTECLNGVHDKVYYWKNNPPRCHSGADLPATITGLACDEDSQTECGEGMYFSNDECLPCHENSFSVGGGDHYDTWNTIPSGFFASCSTNSKCTTWVPRGRYIESGSEDSFLLYVADILTPGEVTFEYKLEQTSTNAPTFVHQVNGNTQYTQNKAKFEWTKIIYNLPIGSHDLTWELKGDGELKIRSVTIKGTKYHSTQCTTCKAGYSTNGLSTQSRCTPCPENTFSVAGGKCLDCGEGEYSFVGSDKCFEKKTCERRDFSPTYFLENCITYLSTGSVSFRNHSDSCFVDWYPLDESVLCTCPPEKYRNGLRCDSCTGTQFPGENGCQEIDTMSDGIIAKLRTYYSTETLIGHLPQEITTLCVGDCITTWSITSEGLNSGKHKGEVYSILTFSPVLTKEGKLILEFSMTSLDDPRSAFYIYVDDILQSKTTHSSDVEIPLEKGTRNIDLVFHNFNQGLDSKVTINNLAIMHDETGHNVLSFCDPGYEKVEGDLHNCHPCPPGYYGGSVGSSCSPCPEGTFSSEYGSTKCDVCRYNVSLFGYHSIIPNAEICELSEQFFVPETSGIYEVYYNISSKEDYELSSEEYTYIINLLGSVNDSRCTNEDQNPLSTHICRIDSNGRANGFGSNIDAFIGESSIRLKYLSVPNDLCETGRSASIYFHCDPLVEGYPILDTETDCYLSLTWIGYYGCRACTPDDLTEIKGECIEGKRAVSYTKNKECYDYLSHGKIEYEECDSYEFPYYIIVVIIGVLLTLVGCIVCTGAKNATLSKQIEELDTTTPNSRINEIGDVILDEDL
eukprot:TRINITY_DN4153_c0_g1_i2.p1 TRINITY_DN4153_c0_g1~~TRINITY_DN4153_c0_g1_i2.p1  ORF type:complete len:1569 (-),score=281.58 TRINITY_DN4153_c0_g1_i2:27-4733(-)